MVTVRFKLSMNDLFNYPHGVTRFRYKLKIDDFLSEVMEIKHLTSRCLKSFSSNYFVWETDNSHYKNTAFIFPQYFETIWNRLL